jgi:hypothetical protein
MESQQEKDTRKNSPQVQRCLDNAAYCEKRAAAATDREMKAMFKDAALQWRELARQLAFLDEKHLGRSL